jgi:hypothetical protein
MGRVAKVTLSDVQMVLLKSSQGIIIRLPEGVSELHITYKGFAFGDFGDFGDFGKTFQDFFKKK